MKTLSILLAAAALSSVAAAGAFADSAQRPALCQAQVAGRAGWVPCTAPQHVKNTGARRDEEQGHDRSVDSVAHGS